MLTLALNLTEEHSLGTQFLKLTSSNEYSQKLPAPWKHGAVFLVGVPEQSKCLDQSQVTLKQVPIKKGSFRILTKHEDSAGQIKERWARLQCLRDVLQVHGCTKKLPTCRET